MTHQGEKTFCILPWIHLAVYPEGSAKLCCLAAERVRGGEVGGNGKIDGAPLSLQTDSLEAVWNSDYMRKVRRDMISGREVADCTNCYESEARSGASWRTHSNARFKEELGPSFEQIVEEATTNDQRSRATPLYYQLMPGNLCNLKCRMCFPTYSSLIEKDELHSRWAGSVFANEATGVASAEPERARAVDVALEADEPVAPSPRLPGGPWYRDDAWVSEVLFRDPSSIRALYFTGGEPMIEPQVEKILDRLLEAGVEDQVTLELNTNCTVMRDELVEKILRFKLVSFSLSVDGYGRVNEYIRYPSSFRAVAKNVDRLAALAGRRVFVRAGPVLQVYNALNLVELLRFYDERDLRYSITIAGRPLHLAVNSLPKHVRQVAADRLRDHAPSTVAECRSSVLAAAQYLESGPDAGHPEQLRHLMLFTNALDADRRQSVRDVHGELLALLGESGFEWTDESASGPPDPPSPVVPAASLKRFVGRVGRKAVRLLSRVRPT